MHTTHAVCLLVRDPQGRVLTISRPHDRADVGLIGGGVEPEDAGPDDETTLRNAMVREAHEEAGLILDPADLQIIFSAPARTRIAVTFRCTVDPGSPTLGENEEGFVSWSDPQALLTGSFGDYNRALLQMVRDTSRREVVMPESTARDESAEFREEELLELEDEDGNSRTFALLAVVEVDGQNFAMLAPHQEMLESEEQLEVALFAYEEDAEGATYTDIEDEALFERVREYCVALLRDEA